MPARVDNRTRGKDFQKSNEYKKPNDFSKNKDFKKPLDAVPAPPKRKSQSIGPIAVKLVRNDIEGDCRSILKYYNRHVSRDLIGTQPRYQAYLHQKLSRQYLNISLTMSTNSQSPSSPPIPRTMALLTFNRLPPISSCPRSCRLVLGATRSPP